jgi:hypothetical protein
MKQAVLIISLLLLSACSNVHGWAAGNNEGAGAGADIFSTRFP